MVGKTLGQLAVGVAAGVVLAMLVQRHGGTATVPVGARPESPEASRRRSESAATHADYQRQIAELTRDLEIARSRTGQPVAGTPAEIIERGQQVRKVVAELVRQRETDQLLAAGFSKERIDWIRKRWEELKTKSRQAGSDPRNAGQPLSNPGLPISYGDEDVALRYEIGEEEYAKYRLALGRSAGIGVLEVPRGSIADDAGLRPDDVIVSYNGKRVFTLPEVQRLAREAGAPSGSVTVEVQRNGHTERLVALRGDMGFRAPPPVWELPDAPDIGISH